MKVGDEFSCLVLTRVTRENMIVLISEDVESEVVGVGDVDMVIMTEENIRVVFCLFIISLFWVDIPMARQGIRFCTKRTRVEADKQFDFQVVGSMWRKCVGFRT